MVVVFELVSAVTGIVSVLSETKEYFFTDRRAKKDTEGFLQREPCIHSSPLSDFDKSLIYQVALLDIGFVDLIGQNQSVIDSERQMVHTNIHKVVQWSLPRWLGVTNQVNICVVSDQYSPW